MSGDTVTIKCARCHCGLQGPDNPQPHDRVSCPTCGEGDTVENVMAEVGEYMKEKAEEHIFGAFRDSKFLKVTPSSVPKSNHRFIIDLDF